MATKSTTKSTNSHDIEVGQRIRARRMAKGMSQTELGNLLGVTFQQVQKYEKGVNRVGAGRLVRVGEALDVPGVVFLRRDRYRLGGHHARSSASSTPRIRCACCARSRASRRPRCSAPWSTSSRASRPRRRARRALAVGNHESLRLRRRVGRRGRGGGVTCQDSRVLLLLAVAIPATAQTFGFSLGAAAPPACLSIGNASYRVAAAVRAPTTRCGSIPRPRPTSASRSPTRRRGGFRLRRRRRHAARLPARRAASRRVKIDATAPAPDLVARLRGGRRRPPTIRIYRALALARAGDRRGAVRRGADAARTARWPRGDRSN